MRASPHPCRALAAQLPSRTGGHGARAAAVGRQRPDRCRAPRLGARCAAAPPECGRPHAPAPTAEPAGGWPAQSSASRLGGSHRPVAAVARQQVRELLSPTGRFAACPPGLGFDWLCRNTGRSPWRRGRPRGLRASSRPAGCPVLPTARPPQPLRRHPPSLLMPRRGQRPRVAGRATRLDPEHFGGTCGWRAAASTAEAAAGKRGAPPPPPQSEQLILRKEGAAGLPHVSSEVGPFTTPCCHAASSPAEWANLPTRGTQRVVNKSHRRVARHPGNRVDHAAHFSIKGA